MNVNYEYDDLQNEIKWQTATSINKNSHSKYTEKKNTLERNRIFNDIHFELSNSFSPHATNTVRNRRPLLCTTRNCLNNFIPFTVPSDSDYVIIIKKRP